MLFGEALGQTAYKIAQKMGNKKTTGKCALAVGDAVSAVLGEVVASKYRGHAYHWLVPLKCATKKFWESAGISNDIHNLPAGSLVVWDRQAAHPYGHIEIADGQGHLCSDFIRDDWRPLYVSNPAKIVPQIFKPLVFEVPEQDKLPYDVVVLCDTLNIRENPSVGGGVVGKARKGDILTVWAIKTTADRVWGKNSKGYFALEFTRCV